LKDCLFCKIINGDLPVSIEYENEKILAFNDINPQAPIHILLIPKVHISTLNDLKSKHKVLVGELLYRASILAKTKNIAEEGYRVGFNCNDAGGQTVYHIHLHLLGGRSFSWPPG